MEQKPSPGRSVHYFLAPTGEEGLNPAFGQKYAVATITGVIDVELGLVNLTVFPDGQEPVLRSRICQLGKHAVSGSRIGASWDWPPRV